MTTTQYASLYTHVIVAPAGLKGRARKAAMVRRPRHELDLTCQCRECRHA